MEGRHKVLGSVWTQCFRGLPFPVPEILEFKAFRDSGRVSSNFPRVFPELSSSTPAKSHSASVGAPDLGSAEGEYPDLFRSVPISPFSSDLFRFAFLVFGNTPICSNLFRFAPFPSDLLNSDLFRFVFRTNQGSPFLPTPFANPRFRGRHRGGAQFSFLRFSGPFVMQSSEPFRS